MVQSLRQTAGHIAKILYVPLTKSAEKMYEYKKTTAIALLAIIILAICAKYVKTEAMHNFNQGLSHAYKVTAEFLRNKTNAILIACIGGVVYLFIGQVLVNKEIIKNSCSQSYSRGYNEGDQVGYNRGRGLKDGSEKGTDYDKGMTDGFKKGTDAPYIPRKDNTIYVKVKHGEGHYKGYTLDLTSLETVVSNA